MSAEWSKTSIAAIAGVLVWGMVTMFPGAIAPLQLWANFEPFVPILSHGRDGTFHWLGTDHTGRDVLAEIVWSARATILFSFYAAAGSTVFSALPMIVLFVGLRTRSLATTQVAGFLIAAMYSVPAIVAYVALVGVLPIGLISCVATAVVVSRDTRDRMIVLHESETRGLRRGRDHQSRFGWLLADLAERIRMGFLILVSVQFVGLWRDWGLGYYVAKTRPYLGVSAGPCFLAVIAIFSILATLLLVERRLDANWRGSGTSTRRMW